MDKLSELSQPVAWIIGAESIEEFTRGYETFVVRGDDVDSTEETMKLYSQAYVSALLAELEFEKQKNAGVPDALANDIDSDDHPLLWSYNNGWNACRAAIQSGNSAQPVTVPDEKLSLDYLQGQKDGLEWAAQMAEASHPQTGDWLYDDPLELAKAIRKGPDMPNHDNTMVIPEV